MCEFINMCPRYYFFFLIFCECKILGNDYFICRSKEFFIFNYYFLIIDSFVLKIFEFLLNKSNLVSQGQGPNEEGSSWRRAVHLKQGQGQGMGPISGERKKRRSWRRRKKKKGKKSRTMKRRS